jgi:hypothetical protein
MPEADLNLCNLLKKSYVHEVRRHRRLDGPICFRCGVFKLAAVAPMPASACEGRAQAVVGRKPMAYTASTSAARSVSGPIATR